MSAYAKAETAELWHRRFRHLGYNNLETLVRKGMVDGINVSVCDFKAAKSTVYEPCIMAKHHKVPFPTSERALPNLSTEVLELLHMDLCGPTPMPSLGRSKYVATFLDDCCYAVTRTQTQTGLACLARLHNNTPTQAVMTVQVLRTMCLQ